MDVIAKYINKLKSNLVNIVKNLENNIEYINNNLWENYIDEDLLTSIINIYYDKYYLNNNVDYEKINNYITINKKTNEKLKKILLSIIDYYESINALDVIKKNEENILYLDILIYLGLKIYDLNLKQIDEPKKIEKVINNIIDNFAKIRFRKEKNLTNLINNIKENIIDSNYFTNTMNKLTKDNSYNQYLKINKKENYYKVLYDYKINELKKYETKDINIVNNELKIEEEINKISYDILYFTNFKLLNKNIKYKFLFPVTKEGFLNNYDYYNSDRNKEILDNIKFIIDFKEIENDYNFINFIREKNIDLYIEVNKTFETNNYNLFMEVKNIVTIESFISTNEKYKEIWKDMDINFIIKDIDNNILLEKDLLRKKEV